MGRAPTYTSVIYLRVFHPTPEGLNQNPWSILSQLFAGQPKSNMKKYYLLLTSGLLCLTLANTSTAALVSGFVLCDANQSLTINTNDAGIPSVLVVVTNQSGTFSNATFTAGDGSFALQIPNFDPVAVVRDPLSQVYVETLASATLPADSTILFPTPITNMSLIPAYFIDFAPDLTNLVYTSGAGNSATGNWLISSPGCQSEACGLTGFGVILDKSKRIAHLFSGNISAADSPDGAEHGHWTHLAVAAKLFFQSTVVQTISCGTVSGALPTANSPDNIIEFSGVGTLKGVDGNKVSYKMVYFTVQAEADGKRDRNADLYYLRVYTPDGVTRLLVSGDPSNPTHIVTVPISASDLRITQAR